MLQYDIPIQRKKVPGNRTMRPEHIKKGWGWLSHLTEDERHALSDPMISLSSRGISEDYDRGSLREEIFFITSTILT